MRRMIAGHLLDSACEACDCADPLAVRGQAADCDCRCHKAKKLLNAAGAITPAGKNAAGDFRCDRYKFDRAAQDVQS